MTNQIEHHALSRQNGAGHTLDAGDPIAGLDPFTVVAKKTNPRTRAKQRKHAGDHLASAKNTPLLGDEGGAHATPARTRKEGGGHVAKSAVFVEGQPEAVLQRKQSHRRANLIKTSFADLH